MLKRTDNTSKLHKTTQTMYKTLLKQKNWTTRPFTCNVSVSNVKSSDLKKQTKNKNGCGLSPTPCALRVPIIHNCSGDRPVNPQCHCSQTTVENEVSKCTARWHYELISPRRSSRPGDAVAGLWKDSQGL